MRGMKSYFALAMMMAACASAEGRSAFMDRLPPEEPKRKPIEPMTPEREAKIMAGIERNMHDFNIHGTIIRAKDRKTALKIYNRK